MATTTTSSSTTTAFNMPANAPQSIRISCVEDALALFGLSDPAVVRALEEMMREQAVPAAEISAASASGRPQRAKFQSRSFLPYVFCRERGGSDADEAVALKRAHAAMLRLAKMMDTFFSIIHLPIRASRLERAARDAMGREDRSVCASIVLVCPNRPVRTFCRSSRSATPPSHRPADSR